MLAKKLANTIFPLGELERNLRGMIGFFALFSANMRPTQEIADIVKAAIIKGSLQGNTFPPKFMAKIRKVTEVVKKREPAKSNPRSVSRNPIFAVFAS